MQETTSKPTVSQVITRAVIGLAVTAALVGAMILWLPTSLYDWVKAVHVIAIIAWMAGMLYLPRLFVYHAEAGAYSPQGETFKVMERRLLRAIINPAMIVAWVLGLWLGYAGGWFASGWFHGKLTAVIALSALHGYYSGAVRAFAEDRNTRSPRFWRIMNEVPTALMVVIVILVIVKPWP